MIVKKKININAKTKTGETALHIACNFQLTKIAELLLNNGIDSNSQDYDNEFTALHYAVNLNNINLTNILLEKKSNPNLQDYFGNTALHYAIIESNYSLLGVILKDDTVNFNLYNINSELPIHILLEKNEKSTDRYIKRFIKNSVLNFQDVNGITPLHYISKRNIWSKYKDILSKKKLNIFVKNVKNKRPIDYIKKNNLKNYIDMVVDSYINRLRGRDIVWKQEWENRCKTTMFSDKLSEKDYKILEENLGKENIKPNIDLCIQIIRKKLLDITINENESCDNRSYPIKVNKQCIDIQLTNRVEVCSFVGITLDIIIGLIYLLKKYPYACSTISTNFMSNNKLCEYYKSVGIITSSNCEFLNFEIVWIYHKLYLSENFAKHFTKCLKDKSKRFIIIPIGIVLRKGSHANYLIYDIRKKEIERFEPYGSYAPYKFDYNPKLLDQILSFKISEINKEIKYVSPLSYMPKIGFQFFESHESKVAKIGDPEGFCALWTIWYTDMRLKYYDIDRKSLVKKMINAIKIRNQPFRNVIRDYSHDIIELRNKVLKSAGLTINDWINDSYNDKQLLNIVEQIKQFIVSIN